MKSEITEKEKTESKKITMRELGGKLPIVALGPADASGIRLPLPDQTFSFIEWDMEIEEKLGKLQDDNQNVGIFVNKLMCLMLDTYCGHDFQSKDLKDENKRLMISQTDWPNMMYMYMNLRCEEVDNDLKFDVDCPKCRKQINNFVADLNTLEVDVKFEPEQRFTEFELKRPIIYNENVTVTGLKLEVAKWNAMEQVAAEESANPASVKKGLFNSAIVGALGANGEIKDFVDMKTLIKKIKKADIEKLLEAIAENNAGPDMTVGGQCPKCKADFQKIIDWRYDSFFGSSSL